MKKLIVLIMVLSLVVLCGCNQAANNESTTTAPNVTDPASNETTGGVGEPTNPIDWETPIDIDDSFVEEQPDETKPTEPGATEPDATQAGTSEPAPTEPDTSETEPSEPAPTKPSSSSGSKPIELPMIPG